MLYEFILQLGRTNLYSGQYFCPPPRNFGNPLVFPWESVHLVGTISSHVNDAFDLCDLSIEILKLYHCIFKLTNSTRGKFPLSLTVAFTKRQLATSMNHECQTLIMGVYQESLPGATITRTIPGTAQVCMGRLGFLSAPACRGNSQIHSMTCPSTVPSGEAVWFGERSVGSETGVSAGFAVEPRNGT